MMNPLSDTNYLLDKVSEECSEVIKEAIKCRLFGWDNQYEGYDAPNGARLIAEIEDLQNTLRVLAENVKREELTRVTMELNSLSYRRNRLESFGRLVVGA